MITNYRVLYTHDQDKLQSAVTEAIQQGWQPLGSLATAHNPGYVAYGRVISGSTMFYQPVVRIS